MRSVQKIKKRILVVGTYPIVQPRHGGQKRLSAIMEEYNNFFEKALYVSVFYSGFYSQFTKQDIPLGREGVKQVEGSPLTGDIICGKAIFYDPEVKKKMIKTINNFKPDIIHIEQPYPYLGLKPLLEELGSTSKIVFGSQNIEGPMKSDILRPYGVDKKIIQDIEREINAVERDLSVNCDLLLACTRADLEAHEKMGATNCVLAPNGVKRPEIKSKDVMYWKNKFSRDGIEDTAVFVGSAHPPNWAGFIGMVGKEVGFLSSHQRVVIAGSVSDYAETEIKKESFNISDATFWLRAVSAGRLSEDRLQGLIASADTVLLPITEGGGSNLKTAEAIIADKKVVATSHALRSFEWFREFPNVWVADSKEDFHNAILAAFNAPKKSRKTNETALAESVLWNNCLSDMVKKVAEL